MPPDDDNATARVRDELLRVQAAARRARARSWAAVPELDHREAEAAVARLSDLADELDDLFED